MMSPAAAPIIHLQRVGVTYATHLTALETVSFTLRAGEFCVVLGASGAGKSTLLRTMNYLTPPTSGEVVVPGLGSLTNPQVRRQHRRQTGMIFQSHHLIERQSALDNVLMGRLAYYPAWRTLGPLPQADQRLALVCLERVGLTPWALTPVHRLSGGQRQRVGIARALAQQPRLLLADEPVASLDPASAHRVLTLLRDICRTDGIAALVSLHQVALAREYGDRILGLAQGRLQVDGPPTALTADHLAALYPGSPL